MQLVSPQAGTHGPPGWETVRKDLVRVFQIFLGPGPVRNVQNFVGLSPVLNFSIFLRLLGPGDSESDFGPRVPNS